jgi:hypothetical protein
LVRPSVATIRSQYAAARCFVSTSGANRGEVSKEGLLWKTNRKCELDYWREL